jgi:hypothetical protein
MYKGLDLWEADSNKSNLDNLSNVRYEAKRYAFQEKDREYLKAKINALATKSKNITDLLLTSMALRRVTSLEYNNG